MNGDGMVPVIPETVRVHLVEVLEYRVNENIRVKLGYAVYGVRSDNAEVCHSYLIVSNDRHRRYHVPIGREFLPCFVAESLVDLFYDRVDPRELDLE
jgi:hypothetical protein